MERGGGGGGGGGGRGGDPALAQEVAPLVAQGTQDRWWRLCTKPPRHHWRQFHFPRPFLACLLACLLRAATAASPAPSWEAIISGLESSSLLFTRHAAESSRPRDNFLTTPAPLTKNKTIKIFFFFFVTYSVVLDS